MLRDQDSSWRRPMTRSRLPPQRRSRSSDTTRAARQGSRRALAARRRTTPPAARAVDERVVEAIEPQPNVCSRRWTSRRRCCAPVSTVPGLSWRVARCALPDGRATTAGEQPTTTPCALPPRAPWQRCRSRPMPPHCSDRGHRCTRGHRAGRCGSPGAGSAGLGCGTRSGPRGVTCADDPILGPGPVHAHGPCSSTGQSASVSDQLETLRSTVAVQLAAACR